LEEEQRGDRRDQPHQAIATAFDPCKHIQKPWGKTEDCEGGAQICMYFAFSENHDVNINSYQT
jgi:hypothetical protein